jgi:hypothetical protein
MFAPLRGANIPKNSSPFPILWEGGRGMGSLALGSRILENAILRSVQAIVSLTLNCKRPTSRVRIWMVSLWLPLARGAPATFMKISA